MIKPIEMLEREWERATERNEFGRWFNEIPLVNKLMDRIVIINENILFCAADDFRVA